LQIDFVSFATPSPLRPLPSQAEPVFFPIALLLETPSQNAIFSFYTFMLFWKVQERTAEKIVIPLQDGGVLRS